MRSIFWAQIALLFVSSTAFAGGPAESPAPPTPAYCTGGYADDFSSLAKAAREIERRENAYTFCIRTAATYECPYYGAGGALERRQTRVVAHGTGFGYRKQGNETLLVTNEHVAKWPAVTDAEHAVDDVPAGCKLVADSMHIVDNESDAYQNDDIPLATVVSDERLDVAVVKAKQSLPILPWKIGKSARLKERNVVEVRGFPLGVFKATNSGKVVSTYDHDDYKDWDHDDFVTDALLSPGNSGSPVLAISCTTGQFELVGVYHAGYIKGNALNAVVGIDQVRDVMTSLRPTPKAPEGSLPLTQENRAKVVAASRATAEPFFPCGAFTAAVRARDDGTVIYELHDRQFPVHPYPIVVLEDLATDSGSYGAPGKAFFGNFRGLKAYAPAALDSESTTNIAALLDVLRRGSLAALAVRMAERDANASRAQFDRVARLEKTLQHASAGCQAPGETAAELADKLGPRPDEAGADLRTVLLNAPAPSTTLPLPDVRPAAPRVAATGSSRLPATTPGESHDARVDVH